jgi:ubiquinone/menaquinone biosynthesis C-methylase UbiE
VIGIGIEAAVIERAREHASKQGVSNARFQVGDIYDLSFPDGSFDAVFIHTVLEHLTKPLKALTEVWRVLKRGGVVGLRHGQRDRWIVTPDNPLEEEFRRLHDRLWIRNGGDPYFGRHQKRLLREAGFVRIEASASCEYYGAPEAVRALIESVAIPMTLQLADRFIELGWVDQEKIDATIKAFREWEENPDAFVAWPMCEAVGYKE